MTSISRCASAMKPTGPLGERGIGVRTSDIIVRAGARAATRGLCPASPAADSGTSVATRRPRCQIAIAAAARHLRPHVASVCNGIPVRTKYLTIAQVGSALRQISRRALQFPLRREGFISPGNRPRQPGARRDRRAATIDQPRRRRGCAACGGYRKADWRRATRDRRVCPR